MKGYTVGFWKRLLSIGTGEQAVPCVTSVRQVDMMMASSMVVAVGDGDIKKVSELLDQGVPPRHRHGGIDGAARGLSEGFSGNRPDFA